MKVKCTFKQNERLQYETEHNFFLKSNRPIDKKEEKPQSAWQKINDRFKDRFFEIRMNKELRKIKGISKLASQQNKRLNIKNKEIKKITKEMMLYNNPSRLVTRHKP